MYDHAHLLRQHNTLMLRLARQQEKDEQRRRNREDTFNNDLADLRKRLALCPDHARVARTCGPARLMASLFGALRAFLF